MSSKVSARLMFKLWACAVLALAGPALASETATYTYDALGRLTKVARSGTVNNNASECYAYDRADNRTNVTTATSADCLTSGQVSFSISSNGAVTEGAPSVFTVTKNGTAPGTLTVNYGTADGTAVAPGDYTAASGTLTFLVGDTSKTVSVSTIDDTVVESAENFTMSLSAPSAGATIATGSASGTINDNDVAPSCAGVTFTIGSNGAVTEGASSVFTISKSGTTSSSCSVNYATASGTATSGSDFNAASGTLTFTPAQTSQTVSVTTIDDTVVEPAETFTMSLSAPSTGSTLGSPSSATATINDNDVANQPPVTHPDSASTTSCGIVTVNVVANDTDPEGNYPLHLVAIVSSTNGSATIVSPTSIEFDAVAGPKTGVVTYTVSDSLGATSNGTLTVSIANGICQ